jgi:hypothetical protein
MARWQFRRMRLERRYIDSSCPCNAPRFLNKAAASQDASWLALYLLSISGNAALMAHLISRYIYTFFLYWQQPPLWSTKAEERTWQPSRDGRKFRTTP